MANGSIAQLGEHLPYKQRVTGSSPVVPTNKEVCRFILHTALLKMRFNSEAIETAWRFLLGPIVQLVRTLACHARGRGFEPHSGRHFLYVL